MSTRPPLVALLAGLALLGGDSAGRAPSTVRPAVPMAWTTGADGIEWSEVPLAGPRAVRRVRVVVARLDPARLHLGLEWARTGFGRPAWTVERLDPAATFAVNAGLFVDGTPWGWLVQDGVERLPPGRGPLSATVAVTRDGQILWQDGDDLAALRGRSDVRFAFQSYPSLLVGHGEVPAALRTGTAIDRTHRDARLALGRDDDGRLLVALTRFDADIPGADRLPIGLTVPEMAELMASLGARQAVLLDGGLSAQLALKDAEGDLHRWSSLRRVPLALVARPRPPAR